MWLSEKIYELLPFLYGIAGLATFYNFETPIAYASGTLFLVAACMVWMMRRDFRQCKVNKNN